MSSSLTLRASSNRGRKEPFWNSVSRTSDRSASGLGKNRSLRTSVFSWCVWAASASPRCSGGSFRGSAGPWLRSLAQRSSRHSCFVLSEASTSKWRQQCLLASLIALSWSFFAWANSSARARVRSMRHRRPAFRVASTAFLVLRSHHPALCPVLSFALGVEKSATW